MLPRRDTIQGYDYRETPTSKQIFISSDDFQNLPMVILILYRTQD
jgi:hypothetical protein